MIGHAPSGRGHAYEVDPDQRVPLRPVAGGRLELHATGEAEDGPVAVEGTWDDVPFRVDAVSVGEARPVVPGPYGRTADEAAEGHLTDAADRSEAFAGLVAWSATLDVPAEARALRYRFTGEGAPTRSFEAEVCRWRPAPAALALDAGAAAGRLVDSSVELLAADLAYRLRFALRLEPSERVVGFGERFDVLDQRGRFVDTAVYDQYKSQGARSYLPMPFAIVAGGGFGFHVDTARRCYFDVGATRADELRVEVDLEPGVADPSVTLRLFDGAPYDVLRAFIEYTAPALEAPPEWTYRLWVSGNEWNSQERVAGELEQARSAGIPVGAVVIEAWSDEQTFVAFNDAEYEPHADGAPHRLDDFTFPAGGRWPDPKALVDSIHAAGTKVLLWQIPLAGSHPGQAALDEEVMRERGYAVREADGRPYRNRGGWFRDALLLDVTSREAVEWWLAKRRYLVAELGVDGFKTDGGEHAWGADLVYADGTRGGETNNLYPVLYARAYQELLRSCGREPVTLSRAGFTGSGAYPWHWAGDADSTWEAFRAAIVAGLTASASGVFFWGWDIAGFSGPLPSVELYLRSAAMAALCPLMQLHSEFNFNRAPSRDRTPWNLQEQTGDARVLPLFRRFALLREQLVPYLARSGRAAVAARRPLMRALFLEQPADAHVWEFPYEYLLGDDLLVAPVCEEGAVAWPVYLPDGEWVGVWDAADHGGGHVVEVDAPLDRIPVFCRAERAHALLPLFSTDRHVPNQLAEVS